MADNRSAKPIMFSGIQPSGLLGLGHYLGAIRHWIDAQDTHQCYFCVVDLHTLTVRQDPGIIRQRSLDTIACYLACGLDPKKSCLFIQSAVAEHSELAWLLACQTMMGELSRMTQFKDKSLRHADNINAGLFVYPVLMAADILLYDTNVVPVGEDQKQHLELARDISTRFNHHYGNCFTIPKPMIAKTAARIMSLSDPSKKMSKSDLDQHSCISLLDPAKLIIKKIKRAVTDSLSEVHYDLDRPGISNLMVIYAALTGSSFEAIAKAYHGKGYGQFKSDLAECLIQRFDPIQKQYADIRQDETYLSNILDDGAKQAREKASKKCQQVREQLGLLPR